MKGAIAELLARINKAPSRKTMMKIGNIQNFFRARMKDHNSTRIDKELLLTPKTGLTSSAAQAQVVGARSNNSLNPEAASGEENPCR